MVYRTTLAPLATLRREMDRIFEDTLGREVAPNAWYPSVDVREEQEAFVFELELPGVEPSAVEVTAENGVLTVRGEKRSTRQNGVEGRWHVVERAVGRFARSFQLPSVVNEEKIEATFAHGVLTIRAAKAERAMPRRIEIKA